MKLVSILFLAMFQLGIQNQDTLQTKITEIFEKNVAPGAVVIVVQGENTVMLETFGLSNLEENRLIDPSKTIFRVGSVSKPFTAIGVLQAVEKGLLDLDKDINAYFEQALIQDEFLTPVTLRHLLTHTAGFDDRFIGKSARSKNEALSLGKFIQTQMPDRLIDSGEISSYSNFGVALAGHVLERAYNRDFNTIMRQEAFEKLGMYNSSFDPDDDELTNFMTGYFRTGAGLIPLQYDYILDAPAGTMVSTAHDMERFMHLLLQSDGLYQAGLISEELTSEMLSVQFTHHPKLSSGFGYLWNLLEYNGHRVIGHDGGYIGISARLWFFPDFETAIFIATSTIEFGFINEVTHILTESLLPESYKSPSLASPELTFKDNRPLSDFAGTWRNTRYSENYFTKFAVLIGFMGHEFTTSVKGDSLLLMPTHTGEPRRLVRVEPLLFQSIDDDYYLAFREENGEITHAFTSGTSANKRLNFWETQLVQWTLIGSITLFFLIISLVYPVLYVLRKLKNRPLVSGPFANFELGIAITYTLSLLLFGVAMLSVAPYEIAIGFGYGIPAVLYFSTLLPYAALIFTILLAMSIFRQYHKTLSRKVFSALVVLCSLVLFACLWYWKLIGWNF